MAKAVLTTKVDPSYDDEATPRPVPHQRPDEGSCCPLLETVNDSSRSLISQRGQAL